MKVKFRLTEHKRNIEKVKFKTILVRTFYQNNVEIYWDRAKVVRIVRLVDEIKWTETLEILKYS